MNFLPRFNIRINIKGKTMSLPNNYRNNSCLPSEDELVGGLAKGTAAVVGTSVIVGGATLGVAAAAALGIMSPILISGFIVAGTLLGVVAIAGVYIAVTRPEIIHDACSSISSSSSSMFSSISSSISSFIAKRSSSAAPKDKPEQKEQQPLKQTQNKCNFFASVKNIFSCSSLRKSPSVSPQPGC